MSDSIDALKQKLLQLQALHASGALSDDAHAAARLPLERELVAQVMAGTTTSTATAEAGGANGSAGAGALGSAGEKTTDKALAPPDPRPSRRLQAGLLVGVVALAIAGYAVTGAPDRAGIGPAASATAAAAPPADGSEPPITDEQVAEIVEKLAQRLKDRPEDVAGWSMLARAYSAMGRHAEAAPAYRKVLALGGDNPDVLADFADTLAALNGGKLSDEATALVGRALALEPNHIKAHALAGSAAYDRRDYAAAVSQWEQAMRALPAESPLTQQLQSSIGEARRLGGLPATGAASPSAANASSAVGGSEAVAASTPPATASPSATASPLGAQTAAAANAVAGISGQVSLAPSLAARVAPDDTLFIVARPASGPRMPLAVLRKQARDLPLSFTLDDSMAMAPNAKISDHAQVIVSARISKSGDAMPKAGDLSGQATAVAPGTQGVALQISEALAK